MGINLDIIFAGVADGIAALDNDLRYVFINDAAERLVGINRESALGHTPMELFPPEAIADVVPLIRQAIATGQPAHYDAYYPQADRWFENRLYPSAQGVTIFFTDVTSRKRAEEALRKSDEGHRLLVSLNDAVRATRNADDVLWTVVNRVGQHFQVSRCTYGEIDRAQQHVIVWRDYVQGVISIVGQHRLDDFGVSLIDELKKGQTVVVADVTVDARTSGSATAAFHAIETSSLICVPLVKDGRLTALFVLHHKEPRDWTEHEISLTEQIAERTWFAVENARAEAALRESRDVLSLAMRGGRMGAWSRNMVTNHVWWSRELEEIFGLPPGGFEGSGNGFRAFVHEDDREYVDRVVWAAVASRSDYVMEFRFLHARGEYRWMEGRGRGVYAPDGTPRWLYGLGIDITDRKRAEQAIAAAREAADADAERLNLALEAARLGDWSWDVDTDILAFSQRSAEIFRLPPGPVMTWTTVRELLHPDDREPTRMAIEQAIATRGPYLTEYRLVNGGRERWILASGRARYDGDRATGMFGVVQDITADRLLVRLDDAVHALGDAEEITYTAARLLGEHLDVNRCAYATVQGDADTFDLHGNYTHETHSIIGRYRFRQFGAECLRLMRVAQPYVVVDSRTDPRITSDERLTYEQTAIRSVICVPIHKAGAFVAAMAVHSVEPRQWSAGEVELVQRVAHRCWESLERARVQRERAELLESAEAANRAKDEFLAMLGHELRNPLSPILTALQLMKLRGDDSSTRERVVIERQVTHLTRLVDDLLDVSRIARGKVELKNELIEISEIVARAIEVASPLLEGRTQTLAVSVPRTGLAVDGDPARLTQILSNLLTNASKYTPADGHIALSAEASHDEVVIRVRDNGHGIAPDVLPRVFDLFVQGGRAIDRAEGGLGLGLTIVRSLTERHHGSVTAFSDGAEKGSEFVVRLPLSPTPVHPAPSPRDQQIAIVPPVPSGTRVLIVDDNADAAEMLSKALKLKGHLTWVAHDGPAALALAPRVLPQVAFLDIGLPVMDGYELAGRLRDLPSLSEVRLVAITGYGQDSDRERSASAGFHHHLVKPVNLSAVDAVLAALDARGRAPVA
jgi:PAS domain S-box-containing protein